MNDDAHHPTSHLFTLRVWLEALGDGHGEWRGQVRYVLTGETYYFRQWDQLPEMLRRCLQGFDPDPGKLLPRKRPEQFKQSPEILRGSELGPGEEEEGTAGR